jgi:carboxyl-terminal processing protease
LVNANIVRVVLGECVVLHNDSRYLCTPKLFMEAHSRPRLKVWTPLIAALIMVAGIIIGFQLRDTLRNKRDIKNAVERSDRLEQLIDLISTNYVDSINASDLYRNGVDGILSKLDPHTVYIPAEDVDGVNEELEGSFYGIGVEFSIIRDTITVTSVVPEGPSDKAGILTGDKLVKVEDTVVAGTGISSDRIVKMLRGEKKSAVRVQVKRLADAKLEFVKITRNEVPLQSIDASIMLDAHTGYIKINRFAATTYSDFAKALKSVKKAGATSLIIDVRDNPGGYLDAATSIADELLDDKKLIVYIQGNHEPKQEYTAVNEGMFEEGRVAILVDESSASAAEILAGAVQDWDRGVVIGRRTFGKGLVQEQYELEDGAALRLTIARYYTPSGRSIQRSFAKGREAYTADFEARFKSGELVGKDSVVEDTQAYYTLSKHRLIHGAGGIKPDIYVPYDSGRLSQGLLHVLLSNELQDAIWDYYNSNVTQLKKFKTIGEFVRNYRDEGVILAKYLRSLPPSERLVAEAILRRAANKEYLLLQIRSQVARTLFRSNGYYSVSAQGDDVIQRALQILSSPQYQRLIGR